MKVNNVELGGLVQIVTRGAIHPSLCVELADLSDPIATCKSGVIYIAITWIKTERDDFVYAVFPEIVGWIVCSIDDVLLEMPPELVLI